MEDGEFFFSVLGNLRYEGFMVGGFLPAKEGGRFFGVQADPGTLAVVAGPFRSWLARRSGLRVGVACHRTLSQINASAQINLRCLPRSPCRDGAISPTRNCLDFGWETAA